MPGTLAPGKPRRAAWKSGKCRRTRAADSRAIRRSAPGEATRPSPRSYGAMPAKPSVTYARYRSRSISRYNARGLLLRGGVLPVQGAESGDLVLAQVQLGARLGAQEPAQLRGLVHREDDSVELRGELGVSIDALGDEPDVEDAGMLPESLAVETRLGDFGRGTLDQQHGSCDGDLSVGQLEPGHAGVEDLAVEELLPVRGVEREVRP